MTLRSTVTGAGAAAAGSACAAATFWVLLNVPESNVLALILSALLAAVTVLILGYTLGLVLASRSASLRSAARLAVRGLPGFGLGLLAFAVLFWLTSWIDSQWALHRGEIDAMFLRYLGTANSAWLHLTIAWVLWLVRWGVGLALIAAATDGSITGSWRGGLRGFAGAFSARPLAATIAALLVGRGLWLVAYWRPRAMAGDSSELAFVAAKLAALFLVGTLLAVVVLNVFAGASRTRQA